MNRLRALMGWWPEFVAALLVALAVLLLMSGCRKQVSTTQYVPGDSTITFTPGIVTTPADTGTGYFNAVAFCDSLVKWRRDTIIQVVKVPLYMTSGRSAGATIAVQPDGSARLTVGLDSLQMIIDSLNKEVRRVDTLKTTIVTNKCTSDFHRFTMWYFFGSLVVLLGIAYLKFRPF